MGWQAAYDTARKTRTANVICMKWGSLYGPEWVNKLYGMVKRNTTWNVRFVCLTDDASGVRSEVECLPLPPLDLDTGVGGIRRGVKVSENGATDPWWNKLSAFRADLYDISGMTLYLDLDVMIVDSIDDFFTHPGRFCMMRIWGAERFAQPIGNSSVVRFFVGQERAVFDKFVSEPFSVLQERYHGSQQRFLSANVEELAFFPGGWCASFKDCLPRNAALQYFATPRLPSKAKIVVFYGGHTPQAAMRGEVAAVKKKRPTRRFLYGLFKKRFRAPPWIAEKWVE